MKVIAHRGACTEALENSWDAFQKAVEAGADRIELDVHLTRDGHLVVVHDEDFQRVANESKKVATATRSDIEAIRLSNGESVPFLDQVLTRFLSQIEFNIEVKSPGLATVEALIKLIEQFSGEQAKIIVSSFNLDTCEWVAQKAPAIQLALLWDKSLWWPGSFSWGPRRFMRRHGIKIFHPDARLLSQSILLQIKAEGWSVFPYIGLRNEQNTEVLWSYLMTLGVDGHCTNYPRLMKLWLQEAADDVNRFQGIGPLANRTS